MLPDSDEFDMLDIHTDQLNFVLPAGWLENNRISADTLRREKFILLTEAENPLLYMQIMNFCRTHRFSPVIANQFSDMRSVLLSVSAGLGISILPEILPEGLPLMDLETYPVDDSYSIECAVAWKKSLLNPAASLFLDIIRKLRDNQ